MVGAGPQSCPMVEVAGGVENLGSNASYVYNSLATTNNFFSVTEMTDSVLVSRPVVNKIHFVVIYFYIFLLCYYNNTWKDIVF
jgi:hypothetical protein